MTTHTLTLLPGMTADVRIVPERRESALAAHGALREAAPAVLGALRSPRIAPRTTAGEAPGWVGGATHRGAAARRSEAAAARRAIPKTSP